MWLLDVSVPRQIVPVLAEFGIEAETADSRGWDVLTNGKLLEAASRAGFRRLLSRDRLFGQSAARSLLAFSEIAIVIALRLLSSSRRYPSSVDPATWRHFDPSGRKAQFHLKQVR